MDVVLGNVVVGTSDRRIYSCLFLMTSVNILNRVGDGRAKIAKRGNA